MDLNGSTACYQHCLNGITMCVQNQWAFLKVEICNGFKWSISKRVKLLVTKGYHIYLITMDYITYNTCYLLPLQLNSTGCQVNNSLRWLKPMRLWPSSSQSPMRESILTSTMKL